MRLKGKLLTIALVPIVLLATAVCIFSAIKVSGSMKAEVQDELTSAVYLLRDSISDANGNNFYVDEDNNLWNNNYNITADTEAVDKVKAATDMVLTVFYGDTRYMTSVTKDTGERALLTQAGAGVIEKVLKNGQEFFAENVDVVGTPCYAYYLPIYNEGDNTPAGMVFAGKPESVVSGAIKSIVMGMILASVILVIIAVVVVYWVAGNISKRFGEGVEALAQVANGDLTIKVNEKILAKKDETGDIARSVQDLKNKLTDIVSTIIGHSDNVNSYASELGNESEETSGNIEQVERAVNEIALGATSQANDTTRATESVITMGNLVEETNRNVEELSQVSNEIEESGKVASENLVALENINEKTKGAINQIYNQTVTTNESAKQISEAINLITSIAQETNLLSLNASIEAARAGEQGRGFAVVASQISKLAEQSNDSAGKIEQIATTLMDESQHVVETMDEVNKIIGEQNEIISKSAACFKEVLSGIGKSREHISEISNNMAGLNESRQNVVDVVSNLSAIAEENAASTEETSASTTVVAATVQQMAANAGELKSIAGDLESSVSVFRI